MARFSFEYAFLAEANGITACGTVGKHRASEPLREAAACPQRFANRDLKQNRFEDNVPVEFR
jgi:hypothetical protein